MLKTEIEIREKLEEIGKLKEEWNQLYIEAKNSNIVLVAEKAFQNYCEQQGKYNILLWVLND